MNKTKLIKEAYKNGRIKKLSDGCYSVHSDLLIAGITPRMIDEVLNNETNKRG